MLDTSAASVFASDDTSLSGKLAVKVGTHLKLVSLTSLMYVRAVGNYIDLNMRSGEIIHSKESISNIASRLPARLFMRIHRSFIVNTDYILEVHCRRHDYDLLLQNNVRLPSGKAYRDQIKEQFKINRAPDDRQRHHQVIQDVGTLPATRGLRGYAQQEKYPTRIRVCVPGDEFALALIGKITFMETYTSAFHHDDILEHCVRHDAIDNYRRWLDDASARTWIVETETCHAPVGYLAVAPAQLPFKGMRGNDLEIRRIYLLKGFQGNGLGKDLVALATGYAVQKNYRRILLGDYKHNEPAIAFYGQMGFYPAGEFLYRVGKHDYEDIVFALDIR